MSQGKKPQNQGSVYVGVGAILAIVFVGQMNHLSIEVALMALGSVVKLAGHVD